MVLKTSPSSITPPSAGLIQRLEIVDGLRGTAAVSVCLSHFIAGGQMVNNATVREIFSHGKYGVHIFFVISGFVIPFALHRSGYRLGDFFHFLIKRIIRLDPPYFVAIALALALGYASSAAPGFRGLPFHADFVQIGLHVGYLIPFSEQGWLNPVFWTLAVEVQYYLAVGLLFGAIASPDRWRRFSVIAGMAVAACILRHLAFLPHWLFIFMSGIAAFQFRVKLISRLEYLLLLAAFAVGLERLNGGTAAIVAISTSLLIALLDRPMPRAMLFFGQISYSLYLVHVPIGGRVVNLGQRWAQTAPQQLAVLIAAVAITITAAWLLWRWVELPGIRWASKIKYPSGARAPVSGRS